MQEKSRGPSAFVVAVLVALSAGCRAPAPPTAEAQDAEVRAGWEWSDEEVETLLESGELSPARVRASAQTQRRPVLRTGPIGYVIRPTGRGKVWK